MAETAVVSTTRLSPPFQSTGCKTETMRDLGRHYRVKGLKNQQVGICLSGGSLKAVVRPTDQGEQREKRIQRYLQYWYRSRALDKLQKKTQRYSRKIGVTPTGVSDRNFKPRWGSCDKKGQVIFNWNIIKAPHAIADYAVIDELCHLIHPKHSKDFWQLARTHDSSHIEHKEWLKKKGAELLQ